MGVEKFLDVSTGHITHEDSQYLSIGYDNFPARVIPHEYGWWINVPEKKLWEEESKADCMRKQGYSEGLISVLMFARNNDCWWVNLDCDGEYVDGLEIFEW
jgi:hypothetical protein